MWELLTSAASAIELHEFWLGHFAQHHYLLCWQRGWDADTSQMSGCAAGRPFNLPEKGCPKYLNTVFIFGWPCKNASKRNNFKKNQTKQQQQQKYRMLTPLTRFLLSRTSVGSVLSGTNWLGSSILIGVPMLVPGCEDFIHWGVKTVSNSRVKKNHFPKMVTRGQACTKKWKNPPSFLLIVTPKFFSV